MGEFKVKQWYDSGNYFISDGVKYENYLHRDGEVVNRAAEYWRTKEEAEAVLEKYRPKHKWVHGDVFTFNTKSDNGTMMYFDELSEEPYVRYLNKAIPPSSGLDYYLRTAKFLFNIKEKL